MRVGGSTAARAASRTLVLLALAVLAAGCAVTTTVSVTVGPRGGGVVAVTVSLDSAASSQVGDLRQELDTAGLAAAGWRVTGPSTSGGTTTVTASHPFSDPAQLPGILAGVAGPPGRPIFELRVARTHSAKADGFSLRGTVNLSCGSGCFGDAALRKSFGSVVGVDAAALEQQYGETPAQALRFRLRVRLPGRVVSSDASSTAGDLLTWTAPLGSDRTVSATAETLDPTGLTSLGYVGAGGAAALLAVVAVLTVRRRPRRRRGAHAKVT